MTWRLHTWPEYVELDELLARAADTMTALRLARVGDWCRDRGDWLWTDVPRCWLESFTYDVWTLEALGEFQVEITAAIAPQGFGTTRYRLRNVDMQLTLSDALAENEDHSRIV